VIGCDAKASLYYNERYLCRRCFDEISSEEE